MEPIEARFAAESGVRFANAGDYRTAALRFGEAIAAHSTDFRYYLNRSYCFFYLGEYEKSLDDANKSIQLSDDSITAKPWFRRAMALFAMGRLEEALESYEATLLIDATCPVSMERRRDIRSYLLQQAGISKINAEILAVSDAPIANLIRASGLQKTVVMEATSPPPSSPQIRHSISPESESTSELNSSTESNGQIEARVLAELDSSCESPQPDVLNQSCGDSDQNREKHKWDQNEDDGLPVEWNKSKSPDPDINLPVLEQVMKSMPDLLDVNPVTNPLGFYAITVSNVSDKAKRLELEMLFSQYGELEAVYRLKPVPGASKWTTAVTVMVHYRDPNGPQNAVEALRSAIFYDGLTADRMRPMVAKLTASPSQKDCRFLTYHEAEQRSEAAGECFEWRGPTGCLTEDCELLHMRACHRVDSHAYFSWLRLQEEEQARVQRAVEAAAVSAH